MAVPNVSSLSKKFEKLTFAAMTPTGLSLASLILSLTIFAINALPIITEVITTATMLSIIISFFLVLILDNKLNFR